MAEDENNDIIIRLMTEKDITGALEVFASHNLYECKHSLNTYLNVDSNGFYVAIDKNKGQVVGVCGGPFLRPDSAFIGLYGVRKEYFGRHIGQKLFSSVLSYIGDRNVGLSALPEKFKLYKDRLGFRVEANRQMVIYNSKVGHTIGLVDNRDVRIEWIGDTLVDQVIEYDRHIHRYRRDPLMRLSLKEPQCLALAAIDANTDSMVGYGCIRESSSGSATLSPLYADNKQIAHQLIAQLVNNFEIALKNGWIYYTIDINESAIKLAEELDLEKHEQCPYLYRQSVPDIDCSKIYSILTPNFSL